MVKAEYLVREFYEPSSAWPGLWLEDARRVDGPLRAHVRGIGTSCPATGAPRALLPGVGFSEPREFFRRHDRSSFQVGFAQDTGRLGWLVSALDAGPFFRSRSAPPCRPFMPSEDTVDS
jgi:hypothetical protein